MSRKIRMPILSCLIFLLTGSGCTTLQSNPATARDVGDKLEALPLGTPCDAAMSSLPASTTVGACGRLRKTKFFVYAFLSMNPCAKAYSDLTLYRQWPRGLLLGLVETDLVTELNVPDNKFQLGALYVLFDRDRNYKGYCAFSPLRRSQDNARFEAEKAAFLELGLDDESVRAKEAMKLVMEGGEALNHLPKLPLSSNRAPYHKESKP
jgi:hypothetical protein